MPSLKAVSRKNSTEVKPRESKPEPQNVVNAKWAERGHHNSILTALIELEEWPHRGDFTVMTLGDPANVWGETLIALAVTRKSYSHLQNIAGNLWSPEERERRPLKKDYAQALLEDAIESARAAVEKTQRFHDAFNPPEQRIGYGM